jgi:hypothetical protein
MTAEEFEAHVERVLIEARDAGWSDESVVTQLARMIDAINDGLS